MFRYFLLYICLLSFIYAKGELNQKQTFQSKLCSILDQCYLKKTVTCPDSIPVFPIKNRLKRCQALQNYYHDSSFAPTSREAKIVTVLKLHPYELNFNFNGLLDISIKKFILLLQNLPLTVKLINIFENKKYEVKYLNPPKNTLWKGTNNNGISGWASLFLGNFKRKNLSYLAYGKTKTIFGNLRGYILFRLAYQKRQDTKVSYNLGTTIYVKNSFMNFILDSWLARNAIKKQISEVLNDIILSGKKINSTSIKNILSNHIWTKKEEETLKKLYQLN